MIEENLNYEKSISQIVFEISKVTWETWKIKTADRTAEVDTPSRILFDIQTEMAYVLDKIKRGPVSKRSRAIKSAYYYIDEIRNGNYRPWLPNQN